MNQQAKTTDQCDLSVLREKKRIEAEVVNRLASVEMRYEDENIWLTQKMMATLYDVSVPAINQHLKRIFADNELTREATVKQYLIVQTEGGREVRREVEHYNLQTIIPVGFKIENEGRCSSANGPTRSSMITDNLTAAEQYITE